MTVLDWLLDSDPALRWQVLGDLVQAPAEVVAAERARVATEGWGARLLALQGDDGQWEGGACFPGRFFDHRDEYQGQPWTSTLPTLQLLCDFGIDPGHDRVRRAGTPWSPDCWRSNSKMAGGTARPKMDPCARRSPPRSTCSKDYSHMSARPGAPPRPLLPGGGARSTCSKGG